MYPRAQGVEGNEVADSYVKWAAETHHDPADRAYHTCERQALHIPPARRRGPDPSAPENGLRTTLEADEDTAPLREVEFARRANKVEIGIHGLF